MKKLYIVETPYHLFNAINLQLSFKKDNSDVEAELIMVNCFKNAEKIYEKVSTSGIFSNTYLVSKLDPKSDSPIIIQWWTSFVRLLFPKRVLKEQSLCDNKCTIFVNRYNEIFASYYNPIVASMLKLNKLAVFNHMDDGIGSYYGDILFQEFGWKYKLISILTHSGTDLATPKYYYLNNPDFFQGVTRGEIKKLPEISQEFLDIVSEIFDSNYVEQNKSIFWITDASHDNEWRRGFVDIIKKNVSEYSNDIMVRLHPRERAIDAYNGFCLDQSTGIWELLVPQFEIEEKILMAYFSTAQTIPKIIYNKEPYLIFLYRIANKEDFAKRDMIVQQLKDSYNHSDRIYVPGSIDELLEILNKLKKLIRNNEFTE